MAQNNFVRPPPVTGIAKLSFPAPRVLLVTISRPKALNAIHAAGSWELAAVHEWFDQEPSLWVGIVTGEGRTFSAGADLKGMADPHCPGCCIFNYGVETADDVKRGIRKSHQDPSKTCPHRDLAASRGEQAKNPSSQQ